MTTIICFLFLFKSIVIAIAFVSESISHPTSRFSLWRFPFPVRLSSIIRRSSKFAFRVDLLGKYSFIFCAFCIVKFHSELLKLLNFRFQASVLHFLEESSELEISSLVFVWDPDTVSQPFWNLRPVRWIGISLVEQKYRTIVLNVTDYTTNGLVYRSCCLLIVPILAR